MRVREGRAWPARSPGGTAKPKAEARLQSKNGRVIKILTRPPERGLKPIMQIAKLEVSDGCTGSSLRAVRLVYMYATEGAPLLDRRGANNDFA